MGIHTLRPNLMGFTLSPKPRAVKNNKWLLWLWYKKIHEILLPFSESYEVYPEFDDVGRLHFHGVFVRKDKIKFHKTQYKMSKLGFTKWETKLTDKWLNYIEKDVMETRKIFDTDGINYIPMTRDTYKQLRDDLKVELRDQQQAEFNRKFITTFEDYEMGPGEAEA